MALNQRWNKYARIIFVGTLYEQITLSKLHNQDVSKQQDFKDHKQDILATEYFVTRGTFINEVAMTEMRLRNNAGIGLSSDEYTETFSI